MLLRENLIKSLLMRGTSDPSSIHQYAGSPVQTPLTGGEQITQQPLHMYHQLPPVKPAEQSALIPQPINYCQLPYVSTYQVPPYPQRRPSLTSHTSYGSQDENPGDSRLQSMQGNTIPRAFGGIHEDLPRISALKYLRSSTGNIAERISLPGPRQLFDCYTLGENATNEDAATVQEATPPCIRTQSIGRCLPATPISSTSAVTSSLSSFSSSAMASNHINELRHPQSPYPLEQRRDCNQIFDQPPQGQQLPQPLHPLHSLAHTPQFMHQGFQNSVTKGMMNPSVPTTFYNFPPPRPHHLSLTGLGYRGLAGLKTPDNINAQPDHRRFRIQSLQSSRRPHSVETQFLDRGSTDNIPVKISRPQGPVEENFSKSPYSEGLFFSENEKYASPGDADYTHNETSGSAELERSPEPIWRRPSRMLIDRTQIDKTLTHAACVRCQMHSIRVSHVLITL